MLDKQSPKQNVPRYDASLDFEKLWEEYPPAPTYLEQAFLQSRDEIEATKNARFLKQMERCWNIGFYRAHWGRAGLEPGDIRSLDDLTKIPPFSVHDLRDSLQRNPLWTDYIGIDPLSHAPLPLVLQTSGGTTGLPRPMIYSPQDRETMNIISGRRFYMQGVRPFDVVQVSLSLGLGNGGLLAREGLWKYSGAVPMMTGSGANTPTRRQIELCKAWGVTQIAGFPAYLRHMATVAREEMGLEPADFKVRGLLVHLGTEDRRSLEEAWNADAYDTYGTNECGTIAAESQTKNGMHVFEDAFHLEMLDPDTLQEKPAGERGTMFITTLFKYAAPLVRFNSNDVSSFATGACDAGSNLQRLTRIYGRSDNMVKLRGTNIFPEAIGGVISEDPRSNGEYVCIVETTDDAGREDMTVRVEVASDSVVRADLAADLNRRLKEVLGVKLKIEICDRGSLDAMTGLSQTSKIKRLFDRRAKS